MENAISNLTSKLKDIKENTPQMIEKLKKLQETLSNKLNPEDKAQKYSIWIVLAIIILFILFGIYTLVKRHIYFNKYIGCNLCHKEFLNTPVSSIDSRKISGSLLEGPTHDLERAYSIWIYVKDHYHPQDPNTDKHVFSHGQTEFDTPYRNEPGMGPQGIGSPSLLLSKDKNDLQFSIPTRKYTTNCDSDNGNGHDISAEAEEEEIETETGTFGEYEDDSPLLEVVNVENIPIGSWFHVVVNVYKQQLEIYIDGKLRNSTVLEGHAIYFDDDILFCQHTQFSGYIGNFRYMPHILPTKAVEMLYKHDKRNLSYLNNLLCNR